MLPLFCRIRTSQLRLLSVAVTCAIATVAFLAATAQYRHAVGCQSASLDEAMRLLEDVSEAYGLQVIAAESSFSLESGRALIRGEPPLADEVVQYVPLFIRQFFLYPPEFIRAASVKRVVLCRALTCERVPRAGVPDLEGRTLYFDVCPPGSSRWYLRTVIHHETFHMFDYYDDERFTDFDWQSLNTPGFKYGSKVSKNEDPEAALFSSEHPGFLTTYSLTAVEEDKAVIFSHLIVDPRYVEQRAARDPILHTKVTMMKRSLSRKCPEMDRAFWESAKRVQEPTAIKSRTAQGDKNGSCQ